MKICWVWIVGLVLLTIGMTNAVAAMPVSTGKPEIQLAILLDTSNSMDGLINQARTQLWNIVNELSGTARHGQSPELQIALYEYGNDRLAVKDGYIRQVLPFTIDLDKVSEKLFGLTTMGGQEYCGQVIKVATDSLSWSPKSEVMKLIFIAGNEPFTQGHVDYHVSCKSAIAKGITVNTIHCGSEQEGISGGWQQGALLADGSYSFIDANQHEPVIPTPHDTTLQKLNTALNNTYIPYGRQGSVGQRNQNLQDTNALHASVGTSSSRVAAKASAQYSNASWDLVDAVQNNTVKLAKVKLADLPLVMQKQTPRERRAYIEKQAAARTQLRQQIAHTNTARTAFLTQAMKKRGIAVTSTLQTAISSALRKQAQKQGFTFTKGNH